MTNRKIRFMRTADAGRQSGSAGKSIAKVDHQVSKRKEADPDKKNASVMKEAITLS